MTRGSTGNRSGASTPPLSMVSLHRFTAALMSVEDCGALLRKPVRTASLGLPRRENRSGAARLCSPAIGDRACVVGENICFRQRGTVCAEGQQLTLPKGLTHIGEAKTACPEKAFVVVSWRDDCAALATSHRGANAVVHSM
jgi:hypothetical protein